MKSRLPASPRPLRCRAPLDLARSRLATPALRSARGSRGHGSRLDLASRLASTHLAVARGDAALAKHRLAVSGAVMLTVMVAAVVVGPLVSRADRRHRLQGQAEGALDGASPRTDDLGQDVMARMLYGGRISLAVGIMSMLIAITLGVVVAPPRAKWAAPSTTC